MSAVPPLTLARPLTWLLTIASLATQQLDIDEDDDEVLIEVFSEAVGPLLFSAAGDALGRRLARTLGRVRAPRGSARCNMGG